MPKESNTDELIQLLTEKAFWTSEVSPEMKQLAEMLGIDGLLENIARATRNLSFDLPSQHTEERPFRPHGVRLGRERKES